MKHPWGWLLGFLAFLPEAWAEIALTPVEPAVSIYDLSALRPDEAVANRYGRRQGLPAFGVEITTLSDGTADTNVRGPVRACIESMGQIPDGPDDPVLVLMPPECAAFDYERYRYFDYGDTTPGADSFGRIAAQQSNPVLGVLLRVMLDPPGVRWAHLLPPGLWLPGYNQFDPADSNAAGNPNFFFSAVLESMTNPVEGARAEVFLPSVLSPLFTSTADDPLPRPSGFRLGQVEPSQYRIPEPILLSNAAIYQAPLCADLLSTMDIPTWALTDAVRARADFSIADTGVVPPYPPAVELALAAVQRGAAPPTALRRDFRLTAVSVPVLGALENFTDTLGSVLLPLGTVRLEEEQADWISPVVGMDASGQTFVPTLTILPSEPQVAFAADRPDAPLPLWVSSNAGNDAFSALPVESMAQWNAGEFRATIDARNYGVTGELRFSDAMARLPVARMLTGEPVGFEWALQYYDARCRVVETVRQSVPLVVFNPRAADR